MNNNQKTYHAIIALDDIFYPDGNLELRDKINNGEKLTQKELSMLPYSKITSEIKIDNSDDVTNLVDIVSLICGIPQCLFEIDGMSYDYFFI